MGNAWWQADVQRLSLRVKNVRHTNICDQLLLAWGVEATLLLEVACRRSRQGGAICYVLHLEVDQSEGVC